MKNLLLLLSILIVFVACSSSKDSVEEKEKTEVVVTDKNKDEAMDHFIDGSMLEMKGQYAEAILEYQDALKLDPTAGINYALAKNYYRLGKLKSAMFHSKNAVNMDSSNVEYNMLLASLYTASNQKDSAEAVFENIVKYDSTNANAHYSLARLYEANKPMQALQIYNKLLDIVGPEWNVLVKIAEINERLGNVENTISTVEKLIEISPSNLELQKIMVEAYFKNKQYDKADTLLTELLESYPEDLFLVEMRARNYLQLGDFDNASVEFLKLTENDKIPFETKVMSAAQLWRQAINDSSYIELAEKILVTLDADSADWQIKAFLGELNGIKGNDSLAIEWFKESAKLAEWNVDIWVRLGGMMFDRGEYTEIIKHFDDVKDKFPNNFVINLLLGLAYGQENLHEDAQPYLQKALNLQPNDFSALYAMGFTLNRLGKSEAAISVLQRALRLQPDNPDILGTMGMIYDELENWEKCDEVYEKALEIDSTNALVLNNYAYSLSERGIQLERALEMVQKSIEVDPGNSSYLDTIGWIYFKLGDYAKAKQYIEESLNVEEDNALVMDHLGDAMFKLGDTKGAIETWKKALELDNSLDKVKEKIEKGGL